MPISTFGRNLKALREMHNHMTQGQLAESIGVSVTTVSGWETRAVKPKQEEILHKLYEVYGVSERDLFGFSDGLYAQYNGLSGITAATPSHTYAPIVGNIAAGEAREAIELSGEKLWIPPEILERDPDTFYLRISGDSMELAGFPDGSYAAVSPNTKPQTGDVAAVKVNGEEATIKVIKYHDGAIYLEPRSNNPTHKRRIIDSDDPDAPYVRILGKAVWDYQAVSW